MLYIGKFVFPFSELLNNPLTLILDRGTAVMSPTAPSALFPMPPYPEIKLDVRPLDATSVTNIKKVPTAGKDTSRVWVSLFVPMSLCQYCPN